MSLTIREAKDLMFAVYQTIATVNNMETLYPDLPGKPPTATDVSWARLSLQNQDGEQGSLSGAHGSRRWDMTGFLTIQVFTPFGAGGVGAYDIAQDLLAAYRGDNSAVWYTNPRVREIGRDGSFFNVNFIINFQYDQIA